MCTIFVIISKRSNVYAREGKKRRRYSLGSLASDLPSRTEIALVADEDLDHVLARVLHNTHRFRESSERLREGLYFQPN